MRRPLATLLLAAFALLAGLRLAAAARDTEAMRCAIACGHAAAATKGAACCPMADAPGAGPSFRTCPGGGGPAPIPLAPGQPALLTAATRLAAPRTNRVLDPVAAVGHRDPSARPLEHVPLLFG